MHQSAQKQSQLYRNLTEEKDSISLTGKRKHYETKQLYFQRRTKQIKQKSKSTEDREALKSNLRLIAAKGKDGTGNIADITPALGGVWGGSAGAQDWTFFKISYKYVLL